MAGNERGPAPGEPVTGGPGEPSARVLGIGGSPRSGGNSDILLERILAGVRESGLAGQGRRAVIAAVCEQENAEDMGLTLAAMRLPLEALGFEVVDELAVFGVFDRGRVGEREDILSRAFGLGRRLAASFAG